MEIPEREEIGLEVTCLDAERLVVLENYPVQTVSTVTPTTLVDLQIFGILPARE